MHNNLLINKHEGYTTCLDCERAWGTGMTGIPKNPPRKCKKKEVQKINRDIGKLKMRLRDLEEAKYKLRHP